MRVYKMFCQRGSNSDSVFVICVLDNEGREDPKTTKSGSLSACQQNAIKTAFRWRADDGPTLNAGCVAL